MAINGTNISVQKNFYNDSQMTDMNSLANALLSKPTELSPIITHLAGKDDKRFPLLTTIKAGSNMSLQFQFLLA